VAMFMLMLGGAILLVCIGTSNMVTDTYFLKKRVKFLYLLPISLHSDNLPLNLR
jgi:hypothetical protein